MRNQQHAANFSSLVLACVVCLGRTTLHAQVLPPDAVVAGMSIAEWGVAAGQWIAEHPAGMNPVEDTTGEFSHLGDQGPVFFLDGTFGGPTVTREVTIRDDQHVLVGLLNIFAWLPVDGETEADLRALGDAFVDSVDQLFLEIDGVSPEGVNLVRRIDQA